MINCAKVILNYPILIQCIIYFIFLLKQYCFVIYSQLLRSDKRYITGFYKSLYENQDTINYKLEPLKEIYCLWSTQVDWSRYKNRRVNRPPGSWCLESYISSCWWCCRWVTGRRLWTTPPRLWGEPPPRSWCWRGFPPTCTRSLCPGSLEQLQQHKGTEGGEYQHHENVLLHWVKVFSKIHQRLQDNPV